MPWSGFPSIIDPAPWQRARPDFPGANRCAEFSGKGDLPRRMAGEIGKQEEKGHSPVRVKPKERNARDMEQISLGEAMKRQRLELRLSQAAVCEGICEVITLSRLENGTHTPAHNRIKALMQRLNMPDDRYYALLNRQEMALDSAIRELSACAKRFECAQGEQKRSFSA